jgi:Uma2 family endonuclease
MNALTKPVSLDDFLAWEERQAQKWEFDGFVARAMTGGTNSHSRIQANLIGLLFAALRGNRCSVHGSELKVRTETSVRYPDALVQCSPLAPEATFTTDPIVVFEILSKSSAALDLGPKSIEYRALPSLKRYVVLHQTVAAAQVFHLDAEGNWSHDFIAAAGAIDLPEVGASIALSDLYAGVEFPA